MANSTEQMSSQEEPLESPWLDEIYVAGFQGNRTFGVKFNRNSNFLIGKNGSGKTTLINLINAGLQGDQTSLFRTQFSELELTLTFGSDNSQYTIQYKKTADPDGPGTFIDFKILGPRRGKMYNQRFYDSDRYAYARGAGRHFYEHGPSQKIDLAYIFERANRRQPVTTWLSILRSDPARAQSPESVMQNPIDRKLDELTKRTSSYLSSLDNRALNRSSAFQKDYFLSLIGYTGGDAFHKTINVFNALEMDIEEANFGKILSHLKLGPLEYRHKLASHFKEARGLQRESEAWTVQDALKIADTLRIHELNEKWLSFERDRADIYESKAEFIKIVNELFVTKNLTFSDRNLPIFTIANNRRLNLSELSSGEKQAYIILSEALVQEGKRAIYLADEPELSLHIEWQQALVKNIFRINPQCQLIFATHSPDILGAYGANAVDVERL